MKVLVCGSRHWDDEPTIKERLKQLPRSCTIIEGGCNGADLIARESANELGLRVITVWANWERFGPSAGPRRNRWMLDMLTEYEDFVLAFHTDLKKSKGTRHTVERAMQQGIRVEVVDTRARHR